jgi:hypothetical protein
MRTRVTKALRKSRESIPEIHHLGRSEVGGDHRGVEGPGRGAAQHGGAFDETAISQQALVDPHLEGSARAAAREDQTELAGVGGGDAC